MHHKGHEGAMLLAYSPFALLLMSIGDYFYGFIGLFILGTLPMIPDIDMKLPIKHRGITHTIWFSLFIGFIFSILTILLISIVNPQITVFEGIFPVLFSFFIGNMVVIGHLLGDAVTMMGIKPLYPISEYKIRIEVTPWLPTRAASDIANTLFLIIGVASISVSIYISIQITGGAPDISGLLENIFRGI